MRTINEIVVHHSITPRDQDVKRAAASFNRTHKKRLHDGQRIPQPLGGTDWPHIAYHYIIGGDGTVLSTRNLSVLGYHASNWRVNQESIGICLTGNFDKEEPSQNQLDALEDLIKGLKEEFPAIKKISGHRHYASKTCPGKNFTDDMIADLNEEKSKWQPYEQAAIDFAVQHGFIKHPEFLSGPDVRQLVILKQALSSPSIARRLQALSRRR